MNGSSILVVGGAGYIGAHTCKALSVAGYLPVTYDNLSTGHREFVKWGPLVEGDLSDASLLSRTIQEYRAQAVIHFAAHAYVGESVLDPQKYYENNVGGTLSLLRAMRDTGCKNIVFSSTCAVYGKPTLVPIAETEPTRPINPYGRSKLMVEEILDDYRAAYGFRSVALRYFNACGCDHSAGIGELRDPETHLIPRAMMHLLGHLPDFQVFGADFDTPDGTAIRDYVHVSDLADAHVAASRLILAGERSGVYNLGTGEGHSVSQVLDAISRETKLALSPAHGTRRAGDPPILVADPALAKSELGWSPSRSGLAEIVKSSWLWHQRVHAITT